MIFFLQYQWRVYKLNQGDKIQKMKGKIMKNKTKLLTLLSAVLLSACGAKLEKSSLPDKLNQLPNNTIFETTGPKLENKNGKWQYTLYDSANKKIVSFDANELVQDGLFDVSNPKDFKVNNQSYEGILKVAGTDLAYGHYGFLEYTNEVCDKFTGECNEEIKADVFHVGQQNKKAFTRPTANTKFVGSTRAMLKTQKRNDYIAGTATLELAAGQPKGNFTFNYDDKNIKKVEAKGVDFENNTHVDEWHVNGKKLEAGEVKEEEFKAGMFGATEVIGNYKLKSENFALQGGFGLKKQ